MAVTEKLQAEFAERDPGASRDDPLLECLALVARLHGRPATPDALLAGLPRGTDGLTPALFVRAAERHGLAARVLRRPLSRISNLVLPAVLLLRDGEACVLQAFDADGSARVLLPESGLGEKTLPASELAGRYSGTCIFVQPRPRADDRAGAAPVHAGRSWFWGTLWRFRRYYLEAMLTAAVINVLALATSLFVMNVYDRVVPNNALETLIVLATGTALAIGFEFVARALRGYFLDTAGRKADLILAGTLFQQALGLRMEARPASTGAFAAHLREFESLRDFITSGTLTALSDLPFVFFFIWVISLIAGPLYQVPLYAIPVVVLVGLVAQAPLAYLMKRHMRESSLKHGILVESLEGLEALKALGAEGAMQGRWENYTALTGESATRSRLLSTMVVNFAALATQFVTVALVIWGVHLIGAGELTVGALIAAVILSGRAMAPLGQLAGLMARFQHVRAAYQVLGGLMRKPVERSADRSFLHRPTLAGAIELDKLSFTYPESQIPVLAEVSLRIRAGERVAVLGRVGSGKSTLLRLILGLYQPSAGTVLLDGTDVQQIDPADVRRAVGYIAQDARLFYGTLRENLTLGRPLATDEQLLEATRLVGIDRWVARHPMGFDMLIGERGEGLSGGQRQAIALARALISMPPVLLLDEPTSAMDHTTEQALIGRLREAAAGRTVVLVTHKPSMLGLVERIIVLDEARVVADGPRDAVLRALSAPVQAAGGA